MQPLRICPGCGIIAPLARTSCNVCGAPFGMPPLVASGRAGGAVLVCVHAADFACKACGIRSPLATVDANGRAECQGCGLQQAFDVEQWTDALTFAHGVADLCGPSLDAIAARSRHAKIGTEFTSSTKTQNAMIMDAKGTRTRSLKTSVSPGHPICKACHVPLDVWREPPATTKTRCPRCNDTAAFALPENAQGAYAPFVGIIANEQRVDRPIAKLGRTQGGVESIVCPQCGAGMNAGSGSELEKCPYCGLAVRIPGTLARQQRRGALPKMEPFWLVLEGPSIGRQRLAAGRAEDPDDGDDDDDDFASHPPPPPGFVGPAAMAWPPVGAPMHYPAPRASGAARGAPIGVIVGVVVVIVLGAVGAGVGFYVYASQDDDDAPAHAPAPHPHPKKR